MPELPEVETVRRGLERLVGGAQIARIELHRRDLRTPMPRRLAMDFAGARIAGVRRRAKYLVIDTDRGSVLNHLGMTGVWRIAADARIHDHVSVHLADGRRLVFNDPRRFGMLEPCRADGGHDALDALGPEPLEDGFSAAVLVEAFRRRARSAVKAVIMDQAVVVGVGNIYAAEALFRAGVAPRRAAGRCVAAAASIAQRIREVLAEAIAAGGSSIDDFRHVNGLSGRFQHTFAVYARAGQPCRTCAATIRSAVIAGRASCWCPVCQR